MDEQTKKTVLRMISYGIYVMTAKASDGEIEAATVNWVTQTSFSPSLVAVCMRHDSTAYEIVKGSGQFTLNMLGKDQKDAAFAFSKRTKHEDGSKRTKLENGKLLGEEFYNGKNGIPVLKNAMGALECKVARIVEIGDHHIIVGQVTDAHVNKQPKGRPDENILIMKDLGENVFYAPPQSS